MNDPTPLPSDQLATPQTDAVVEQMFNLSKNRFGEYVPANHARAQERRIAELLSALTHAKQWLEGWASAEPEIAYIEKAIQKATQP